MTSRDLEELRGPEVLAVGQRGRAAIVHLVLRTATIRALALAGTAILARILLPEHFGTFAVVSLLVTLVGPVADFGIAAALIQQRDAPTERELATAFSLQVLLAGSLMAIIWLLAPLAYVIAPTLPPDIESMIRVMALVLPLIALRALPAAMMSRVLRFGPLAAIEVAQHIVYLTVAIGIALAGGGAWSFVWAAVLHALTGATLANLAWRRKLRVAIDRQVARRLLGFGLPVQATVLLTSMREGLVPVFGGLGGGLAAIGYLNFSFRLGQLAGSLDEIVGRVAFPAFSRLQADRARLSRALTWALETTALMLAAVLTWAIAVAPTLVPFIFSETWRPAVEAFQLVAVATFVSVPGNFLGGLAFAAGRGKRMLVWSAASLAFAAIAFPVLLIALGVPGGGLAYALYAIVQLVAYAYETRDIAVFPWIRLVRIYTIAALAGGSAALVNAVSGGSSQVGVVVGLVVSAITFGAVFGTLMLLFEREQVRRAWRLLRGEVSFRDVDGAPAAAMPASTRSGTETL